MYATLIKGLLFVSFCTAQNAHTLAAASDDVVSSGSYLILHCNSSKPSSAAEYLQDLLPQISANLQAVIADAQLGTASRRGYEALFKTNDSIREVTRIYKDMAAGTSVRVRPVPGRRLPGPMTVRPTFVCINDSPKSGGMYGQCINDHPEMTIKTWTGTELIALCPLFWDKKGVPVPRTDCPRLKGNILSPNSAQLSLNQEAMIVYELAYLYGNMNRGPSVVVNIQDAVELNATASLANPNNFALYYAAVRAGCRKWPKPGDGAKFDNRGLLEVATDTSTDDVFTPITAAQSSVKTPTTVASELVTGNPKPFDLQIRQSSCLSWTKAPNSTVCCDQTSGEWIEAAIQTDTISEDPACPAVVGVVAQDGGMQLSTTQAAPAAAQTTWSSAQQNYCYGQMRLPNSTVCCDMNSGVWIPAPVITDTVDTTLVSAACPDENNGSINT